MKKSKKSKKKQEPPLTRLTISAKHEYSDDEKQELAKSLASSIAEKERLEAEKKTAMKDWATRISAVANRIADEANKVTSGYEFRDTECFVHYDSPKKGRKSFLRVSDNKKVDEREMTDADRQLLIPEVEKETTMAEAIKKAEKEAAEDGRDIPWSDDQPGNPAFGK